MNSTRSRLLRDAFVALCLSVLAGIAAAFTLALIVIGLVSVAHAATPGHAVTEWGSGSCGVSSGQELIPQTPTAAMKGCSFQRSMQSGPRLRWIPRDPRFATSEPQDPLS
jgi:hypothetical protein